MKTIILIRHAKTEPLNMGITDYERQLKPRGYRDSELVVNEMNKRGIQPDLIISSPASRAKQTTQIFAKALHYDETKIEYQKFIYDGYTSAEFIDYLGQYGKSNDTIMVVGHNPEIAMMAINLTDGNYFHFPTTAATAISYDIENWEDMMVREGKTEWFIYPKMFKEEKSSTDE